MSLCTDETVSARAGVNPLDSLWQALHTNGYLNSDNTALALPAVNQLGPASISAFIGNAQLFPTSQLSMALTQAQQTATSIVLTGTINGSWLGVDKNPAAIASFTLDTQQQAQLTVAMTLPSGYTLSQTFSALANTPPGTLAFSNGLITGNSAPGSSPLSLSATPSLSASCVQALWSDPGACLVTGGIALPTSAGTLPAFQLQSPLTSAAFDAGMAPMQVQIQLTSVPSATAPVTLCEVLASVAVCDSWTLPVLLSLPLPLTPYPGPNLTSASDLEQPVTDLIQLAPLFMGQALANLIPARFPIGNKLKLTALQLSLPTDCSSVNFLQLTVTTAVTLPLLPNDLANLESISITFCIGPGSSSSVQVIFNGLFDFGGKDALQFNAGFVLPQCLVYANNVKAIDVGALVDALIPGLKAPNNALTITTLQASASIIDSTYSFSGAVQVGGSGGWAIDIGRGVSPIVLQNISLRAARSSVGLSVSFGAQIALFGSQFVLEAAHSAGNQGWIFVGQLAASTPLKLATVAQTLLPFIHPAAIPDIELTVLQGSFDTQLNTFMVQASLIWQLDMLPITISANLLLQSQRATPQATSEFSGYLKGEVDINNLVLGVSYIFSPNTQDIIFQYQGLTVDYHRDPKDSYVAISLNNSTVGSLVEFLIAFADPGNDLKLPAPWDALEKVSLPNLTVRVHLQTKEIDVEVDMGVNLGFIDITKFTLSYTRPYGQASLNVGIFGTFLGQDYSQTPLGWDMLNEPAPAVPGAGTQVFDLEYLGLGQHLAIRGAQPTTMDAVIAALENALTPTGNPSQNPATQLPGLMFDASSDWLIGTRFTVMSTCELSVIFNDPNLYGLLIQLSGGKAGVFAGLRFEILYRKISDTIGLYHIELTLPDAMRHLEFGEVSITLPIVTVDIYTNGNFRIDCGFPPNLTDFSRSFSVQVFPFIGFGGFYFAVLNGQTSAQVPVISGGTFSPVLEFGFALQVGVGKTLSLGILSGGISITVGGMLQGVLAWYNPDQQNLPSQQFYKLIGTVAIIGEVYATVDFGIIQASVSLTVYASALLDMECYKALLIEVSAGVSVNVSIKILFIRIHFSFSATITESFVIGSDSTPPWQLASSGNTGQNQSLSSTGLRGLGSPGPGQNNQLPTRGSYRSRSLLVRRIPHGLLRQRPPRLLSGRPTQLRAFSAALQSAGVNLALRAATGNTAPTLIDVSVMPMISQALCTDFSFAGGPVVPSGTSTPTLAVLLGVTTSTDLSSGFNQLMSLLLDWAVESIGHEQEAVSAAVIDEILQALQAPTAAADYFSYTALVQLFESSNIAFNLVPRPASSNADQPTDMAFMAMIPEVGLQAPGYSINFTTDRKPVGDYETTVQQYFANLMAQFAAQQSSSQQSDSTLNSADDNGNPSLATQTFCNYFLMLARSAIQSAKEALASRTYTVADAASATLNSIANSFNNDYSVRAGDNLTDIAAMFSLSPAALQAANPGADLTQVVAGQNLFIPALHVQYTVQTGDNGVGLAAVFGLSLSALQTANSGVDFNNLTAGMVLSIPSLRVAHTALPGETGSMIATEFGVPLEALVTANPTVSFNPLAAGTSLLIPLAVSPLAIAATNQSTADILVAGAIMPLGDITVTASATDSLTSLAQKIYGATGLLTLLTANQDNMALLNPGQMVQLGSLPYQTRAGDTLAGIAAYWEVSADNLSAANTSISLLTPQTLTLPLTARDQSYTVESGDSVASVTSSFAAQGLTLDALLQYNLLQLTAAQALTIPQVQHTVSNSYFVNYTATTGDTLNSIAAAFFPANQQTAAVNNLQQWNGNISPGTVLTAGTNVHIPYISTLGNICRVYAITLQQLSQNTAMGQAELLYQRAPVHAAQVQYSVLASDTLASIAQNWNLSLEQLVNAIATTPGLFAAGPLTVAALPAMLLVPLAALLASNGAFTNAANMASRFMLNGLCLPAPQFAGLPAPSLTLAYPLYALIGQSFPVTAPLPSTYSLTLNSGTSQWVQTPGGALNLSLTPDEIQRVQDFQNLSLQPGIVVGQMLAMPLYRYKPDSQPVGLIQGWDTADLPSGLTISSQQAGTPSLWPMPPALMTTLAASAQGFLPYQGVAGHHQPDGSVKNSPLQASRWATVIDITVQQLPTPVQGTYLVVGADQDDTQRLLALWAYMNANGATGSLYLAYNQQSSSSQSSGLVTDLLDRQNSFLLKTNLSTANHGPANSTATNALQASKRLSSSQDASPVATLAASDTSRFLELLWECSVVNSGGFYLRYAAQDGQLGLPGTLFQNGRQATISLIIALDEQTPANPLAFAFNNALLVGDNIDTGSSAPGFQAITHTVATGDTLSGIASQYSWATLDAAALVTLNRKIFGLLVVGSTVAGQTVEAMDTFTTLAARAQLTVAALASQIATTASLLTPGVLMQLADDPLEMVATLPPGHVGFTVARQNPQASDPAQETAQQALDTLFNLLGFQLLPSSTLSASNEGLPAGPVNSTDDSIWNYRQTLAVFRQATVNAAVNCQAWPPAADNPYAGNAPNAVANIDLGLQDILGNGTVGADIGAVQADIGYTDPLIALSTWPSITNSYTFVPPNSAPPTTASTANWVMSSALATDHYMSGSLSIAALTSLAAQDAARYQAISYQLQQPDVTCSLDISLGLLGTLAEQEALGASARLALLGTANSAWLFLNQVMALTPVTATTGSNGTYTTLADMINPAGNPAGYPVTMAGLAQANATSRADLLFGSGANLAIPVNTLATANDTPATLALAGNITLAALADNNAALPLLAGTALSAATRIFTIPKGSVLCLQAIAASLSAPLLDGPGNVTGMITTNTGQTLSAALVFVWKSYTYTTGQFGKTDTLNTVALAFTTLQGSAVSAADVAIANRLLNGIFPVGTALSVPSYLTQSGDTLATVANLIGPPTGFNGTAAEQLLEANQAVPGIWPIETAIFIKQGTYTVAEGDTLSAIALAAATTVTVVFTSNATLTLAENSNVLIAGLADNQNLGASLYQAGINDTFAGIAGKFAGWSVAQLVGLNQYVPGLFAATPITIGSQSVTPALTDTFTTLAAYFSLPLPKWAEQVASLPGLVRQGGVLAAPAMQVLAGESLAQTSVRLEITPAQLVSANACLPGLLSGGQTVTVAGLVYATTTNDAFGLLLARINADRISRQLPPVTLADLATAASNMVLTARNLMSPPCVASISGTITPAYGEAIQPLTVRLTISRIAVFAAPAFRNTAAVLSASTLIPAQPLSNSGSVTLGLTPFAANFEQAFPGLKLATGPAQVANGTQLDAPCMQGASGGSAANSLWVVNFSGQGSSFAYQVQGSAPRFFGLPPLTTTSWSYNGLSVPTYNSSTGLQWPSSNLMNFQAIDPDQWNQSFLAAVDLLLSPEYAIPGMTDSSVAASITSVLAAKNTIAQALSGTMAPVIGTDSTGLAHAQTAMQQQLLNTLSSAYQVQTLVQFPVSVSGSGADGDPTTAPQISGKLVSGTITTYADNDPLHPVNPQQPLAALAALCGVNAIYMAAIIANLPGIIRSGVTVTYAGNNHVTAATDTLLTLAASFGTDVASLAAGMTIGSGPALLQASTVINVTTLTAPSVLETLSEISTWLGDTDDNILQANADRSDFFQAGIPVTVGSTSITPAQGQSLASVAQAFGGLAQLAQRLTDVDAQLLHGSYTLNSNAPPRGLQLLPQCSFTSTSASLVSNGSSLTSLFSIKDPTAEKNIMLNLEYRMNQIEFGIHSVAGIDGYLDSEWLTFVIPVKSSSNTNGDIGQVQIPVPLRGYPQQTVVSNQSAAASTPTQTVENTEAQWDYQFTTSRQMAAQDQVGLTVLFNSAAPSLSMNGGAQTGQQPLAAVIEALAGFAVVWPAIASDLAILPDITAGAAPTAAQQAAAALATLSQKIQQAWQQDSLALAAQEESSAYTYTLSPVVQGNPPYISALWLGRDGQTLTATPPDDFIFSSDASGTGSLDSGIVPAAMAHQFSGYGFPLSGKQRVMTNHAQSDWCIVDPAVQQNFADGGMPISPQVYRVLLQTVGSASYLTVYRQFLWPALSLDGGNTWQNAEQAGDSLVFNFEPDVLPQNQHMNLALKFYRLNILLRQNAWGGSTVSRNADLVTGAAVNPAFIYQTPEVMFPTQLAPCLQQKALVALAGSNLTEALSGFFQQLLAAQAAALPGSTRTMDISAHYWQAMDGVTPPYDTSLTPFTFQVPLTFLPSYAFQVSSDGSTASGGFCNTLASVVEANAQAAGIPLRDSGVYLFKFVLYSTAITAGYNTPSYPLLEIQNVYFLQP